MSLYLLEIRIEPTDRPAVERLIADVAEAVRSAGGEVVESQVTGTFERIFTVVEAASAESVATAVTAAVAEGRPPRSYAVTGPDEVRLVGADLEEVKAARPEAGYLVEWDLPAELDMESYLARKKANAPKYAEVPEVSFLRTYVREDMAKCLCLYDAPDEEAVRRARKAVQAPVDRLHALDGGHEG
ncbi:DUF4242 domain-containing protein [Thermomonospora curvata]|uniref:DUF4242 domain-containing protein n=1 Tax=Thermomonospora curvata (strain ATCC 19995 / DSM 43183 / JCM 3096 / KCTC 9072 / NBRC 15933 / NCIMB 10081 / Henssen B9) TaxID=471852 RepID=D1AAM0_THECD|nr:DUF4242 domain-containing protein [Thermomonospora curvata]ACY97030.1 hypothetical protein Tcur_1451 [Thermomonospora curvata DSM 43183]